MAEGWQQPVSEKNKTLSEDLFEDDELSDFVETSDFLGPFPPKATTSDTNPISYGAFVQLIDNPNPRAILELNPSFEMTASETEAHVPAERMVEFRNEEALGKDFSLIQPWSDQVEDRQQEVDWERLIRTLPVDFSTPGTHPSAAAGHTHPLLETGALADVGLPVDRTYLASAEGIPGSQADMKDIEDGSRLPDLLGSPLSDYDFAITEALLTPKMEVMEKEPAQVPSQDSAQLIALDIGPRMSSKGTPHDVSGVAQQKRRRGRRAGDVPQVPGFPSFAEPLPPNLTLEEIARGFPNHLTSENLQPFIRAGWGGKRIWNLMPEAAKKSASKERGWNKMNRRLMCERKKMEVEGLLEDGVTSQSMWNSLAGGDSDLAQQSVAGDFGQNRAIPTTSQPKIGLMQSDQPLRPMPSDYPLLQGLNQSISPKQESTPKYNPPDGEQKSLVGATGTTPLRIPRRLRMFPNAPSTNVVLTEQDLADPDHILQNFPEHLSLHHVMEQFLRPVGSNKRGMPTREMVAKLRNHHNVKHGLDLNHPGRDQGLWKWIMSQKDAARRARYGPRRRAKKQAQLHLASSQEDLGRQIQYREDQIDSGDADAGSVDWKQQRPHPSLHGP